MEHRLPVRIRRPLVRTGTDLLGLVKHPASVEVGYFRETFDRPFVGTTRWDDNDAEPSADMWATQDESGESIVDLYRKARAHTDAINDSLDLDSKGRVRWWSEDRQNATLHLHRDKPRRR